MAKPSTELKFTYEDYKNLPESETKRYELLEGELVMVPSPSLKHQLILGNLVDLLRKFVGENDLGMVLFAPLDVILSEETVLQPDILFIAKERTDIAVEEGIRGAPDLVVEVLSKGTADRDSTLKKKIYTKYGVREYWLVDPDKKTVEVLTLGEKGFESVRTYGAEETLTSLLLPELAIDLGEVF